jgi:hypothetical protein
MKMNISKEYYHHKSILRFLYVPYPSSFSSWGVLRSWKRAILDDWRWLVYTFLFSSFVPHIIVVALCRITLLNLWAHTSWIFSCISMILHVRTQSTRTLGCRPLCVIHRGLLQTCPRVGCCQLVPSLANATTGLCFTPRFWIPPCVV